MLELRQICEKLKIWEIIRLRVRVLNATGSEFYWWRKPEYPEKTTQVRK
jgi:hypothetical protein